VREASVPRERTKKLAAAAIKMIDPKASVTLGVQ
jgi:hypothetical protein